MQWQAWATLAIIAAAVVAFASEKIRIDMVALTVLALLVALGIVNIDEALSGFSNEATVTVAAMFALSLGIERSGALEPLGEMLSRIRKPWLLTLALMVTIAPMGAFVKNIALVATFLPLALRVCSRSGTSPAQVLMPMAYAAQMGGVCTLIGTSSNLLTNSLAQKNGLPGFGVFEFTRLGAILAVVGIVYLMLVGRRLLPKRVDPLLGASGGESVGKYVTELRITQASPLRGSTIADARIVEHHEVFPLELLRGNEKMWSPRFQKLERHDVLLVRGDWEKIEAFRQNMKLEYPREPHYTGPDDRPRVLVELMIAPASAAESRHLSELDLGWRYDGGVLAIHRRGHLLHDSLGDVELAVGDVLLLLTEEDRLPMLRADDRFIVLGQRASRRRQSWRKAWLAVGTMGAVVVASGLHWMPIPAAAICGVVAMAAFGCFGYKDVYEAMDWKIIVLLGAILPLGIAIEKTGVADELVTASMQLLGDHGPLAALLLVYLLTALLTEIMGHNPSVVLMVGIAISVAQSLHADPRPFVVAVAFAAATSFATPVGYPTNTMVYYAGGYRFTDFMRVGIPLIAIFCAISMWLIPLFWPFYP